MEPRHGPAEERLYLRVVPMQAVADLAERLRRRAGIGSAEAVGKSEEGDGAGRVDVMPGI